MTQAFWGKKKKKKMLIYKQKRDQKNIKKKNSREEGQWWTSDNVGQGQKAATEIRRETFCWLSIYLKCVTGYV